MLFRIEKASLGKIDFTEIKTIDGKTYIEITTLEQIVSLADKYGYALAICPFLTMEYPEKLIEICDSIA